MVMLQLYSNPRCIYREYIQNALDSINDAVRLGILKRVKDGQVSIHISSNNVIIEDNGTGIQSDCAVKYLTDIANSFKNGVTTAGLYGVGRLSGGGYCEILEFETSYQGEGIATIVSMDTRILRRLLDENQNEMSAEEAMCKICTTETHEAEPDQHYFVVRLKNVINSADILLNKEDILQYIREVAPIDYCVTFNSLINSSDQREFVEKHKALDKIKVSLNETADIEKSYDLIVKGSGDNIEKIRYFELPAHEKFGKMGWGWYAVTDFSVQISDEKDPNVGIRLRKHNISLDKNILNAYFKEARGNKYFYGEIFISNDKVHPDSGRQGLAASEEADALIKTIREYFSILHLVYNKASRLKSKLKAIQDVVESIKNQKDTAVINILIGRLKDSVNDFNKFATDDSHEEVNDVISIYRNKYVKNLKKEVDKLLISSSIEDDNTSCIVQEPGIVEIETNGIETIHHTENSTNVSNQEKSSITPSQQTSGSTASFTKKKQTINEVDVFSPFTSPQSTVNSRVRKNTDNNSVDIFLQPLVTKKIYTSEQLSVLRKVLNTMLLVCPSAKKKNLSILMQSAIASLG